MPIMYMAIQIKSEKHCILTFNYTSPVLLNTAVLHSKEWQIGQPCSRNTVELPMNDDRLISVAAVFGLCR